MSKIEYAEVADELRRIAATHPRKKNPTEGVGPYQTCIYTDKWRKRHCLAGQVAHNLGVHVPTYTSLENRATAADQVQLWRETFTSDALNLLCKAQYEADQKVTWGEAMKWVGV